MIEITDKTKCCGCYACYNICPKNAIIMKEDEKGFKYPIIDKEKCVNCGLCDKVCPIIQNKKNENEPKAYACYNKNEEIRKQSSSGGIFTLLAEEILNRNGIIFGAAFDNKFLIKHISVETIEELEKLRGSKYAQSQIGETYKKAKIELEKGRHVLFTGTPCQIEGLKTYLGKEYENLYTQDIICHGVPSPKVLDLYMKELNNKHDSKIVECSHRSKIKGWKNFCIYVKFQNKETYVKTHHEDLYMKAFLKNTILRDSCYKCSFKKLNRISDITLGDFWGVQNIMPEFDDDKGLSLVVVNSKKGQELFEKINKKIVLQNVNLNEAIKYNECMIKSVNIDKNREKFFDNINKMDFDKLVKKYTYRHSFIKKCFLKVKEFIN